MRTLVLASSLLVGGCATLFSSSTETVHIQSSVPGAQVTVDGMPAGRTPAVVEVDNHKSHTVVVTAPDGSSSSCRLHASAGAGWIILDVLGGVIPIIIDAITGAWVTLDDTQCYVHLTSAGAPGRY